MDFEMTPARICLFAGLAIFGVGYYAGVTDTAISPFAGIFLAIGVLVMIASIVIQVKADQEKQDQREQRFIRAMEQMPEPTQEEKERAEAQRAQRAQSIPVSKVAPAKKPTTMADLPSLDDDDWESFAPYVEKERK